MANNKTTTEARTIKRSAENTTATFSLTKAQMDDLKRIAERENRTVSNFLRVILAEEIKRRQAK